MSRTNNKQKKFIKLVTVDNIAPLEALKLAGYSDNTIKNKADEVISNIFKKYDIKQVSQEIVENGLLKGVKVDVKPYMQANEILAELTEIARNQDNKLFERLKALDMLCRCNGMYINKLEVKTDNYADILNQARARLISDNTIDITPISSVN